MNKHMRWRKKNNSCNSLFYLYKMDILIDQGANIDCTNLYISTRDQQALKFIDYNYVVSEYGKCFHESISRSIYSRWVSSIELIVPICCKFTEYFPLQLNHDCNASA